MTKKIVDLLRDQDGELARTASGPSAGPGAPKNRKKAFFSFEFFPPKNPQHAEVAKQKMAAMGRAGPLWVDFKWTTETGHRTLDLCEHALALNLNPMLHVTCAGMTEQTLLEVLNKCKERGIRNVLALRGDIKIGGAEEPELIQPPLAFPHAAQLVRFIRIHFGDFFCIAVGGYPERHPESPSAEEDLRYLGEKIAAGADLVLLQVCYDVDAIAQFGRKLKQLMTSVSTSSSASRPFYVVPGLLPLSGNYEQVLRMATLCHATIPQEILQEVEDRTDDPKALEEYGLELCGRMCEELLDVGGEDEKLFPGIHFYTMNRDNVLAVVGRRVVKAGAACSSSSNEQEPLFESWWPPGNESASSTATSAPTLLNLA
eukprot:g5010.t1